MRRRMSVPDGERRIVEAAQLPRPTRRAVLSTLALGALGLTSGLAAPRRAMAEEDLDRILARKLLRFGIRTDAPPFASLGPRGFEGFAVDLCVRVHATLAATGETNGLDAKFVKVDTSNRFEMIRDREIDVLCGATTVTLGRREIVSFSLPIFATGIGAVIRMDAPEEQRRILVWNTFSAYTSDELARIFDGVRVGVRSRTTAAEWLGIDGPFAKVSTIERHYIDDHFDALRQVRSGDIDLYFGDQAILKGLLQHGGLEGLEVSRATYTYEPYALAIPRGDEDLRLLIDRTLADLYRTGAILEIYEEHFGSPPPEVEYFYTTLALPR